MGCTKEISFAAPPSTDAHLSYYWTMDEAGDLNKVDSAAGYSWVATTGNLSPPGLFANGLQLDCAFVGGAPFFHGLQNLSDAGFACPAGSTGVSFWFWIKQTVDPTIPGVPTPSIFEWSIECHDVPFSVDASVIFTLTETAGPLNVSLTHNDFTLGNQVENDTTLHPVTGAWHMIAGTLDLTAKTLNLYIDGALVVTNADVFNFYVAPLGSSSLKIDFPVGVQPWELLVDEFGLSLKGALSQSQITALYNSGAGKTWPNITAIVPYP